MESLLVLVGLIVLAIPVAIVVLLVSHTRLRRRVELLERQVLSLGSDAPEPQQAKPRKPTEKPDKPSKLAPWSAAKAQAVEKPTEQTPPAAVVFREDRLAALTTWLRENWFYAVSALSLALAGIFLVQYGVESGLLPPSARVIAALLFGAALICAGEVIRRKYGDDESTATVYLPSVFSGAGLVTLFGGVLAARQLYDLIGPEAALMAMIAVAMVGLVLGWFHGPLLAAVGLIGAFRPPSWLVARPRTQAGSTPISLSSPFWVWGSTRCGAGLDLGSDLVRDLYRLSAAGAVFARDRGPSI